MKLLTVINHSVPGAKTVQVTVNWDHFLYAVAVNPGQPGSMVEVRLHSLPFSLVLSPADWDRAHSLLAAPNA